MKLNKFFAIASAVLVWGGLTTSCDTLDIDNLESYDESMVWGDLNLATAYINNLYAETFGNWSYSADSNSEQLTGMPWKLGTITETGDEYKKWTYTEVRHINEGIKRLENSTELDKEKADAVDDSVKQNCVVSGQFSHPAASPNCATKYNA